MKKIKLLLLIVLNLFVLCGCEKSSLENAQIYTTVYPVKYITEYLYGNNSTVESIYPDGVDLKNYSLTEKQIEKYSSGDLFVYIGLGNEKELAKSFINRNNKLLIIDATYGLSSNNIVELWLAPNNFLMLVKNIRNSLNEYLDNGIKEDEVNKYYNELYEKISWLDAELRNIAKDAKENGKNTLVVATDSMKFLEGYGFNVISLESIEKSGSENAITDVKNKFKSSTYTSVIKLNSDEKTELIGELEDKYKAKILEMNDLVSNHDTASDYITIQYENIAVIRDLLLK